MDPYPPTYPSSFLEFSSSSSSSLRTKNTHSLYQAWKDYLFRTFQLGTPRMGGFRHLIISSLAVQILCRLILSFIHPSIQSSTHYIIIMCILYGLGGHCYFDYQYDRGNNYMPSFCGFLGINRKFKENETALLKVT